MRKKWNSDEQVSFEKFSNKKKDYPEKTQQYFHYTPLNENQRRYYHSMAKNVITIGKGVAGSSKTYTAVAFAVEELNFGTAERIVICRANLPTGRTLGSFPGTVEEKILPWVQHIISYAKEFTSAGAVNSWMRGDKRKIFLEPIETLRGRSFSDSVIIVDEAQQLTFEELKCIVTRIGKNSRLILCGDTKQSDLRDSGLQKFIDFVIRNDIPEVGIVEFTIDDIVRSDIVKNIIIALEKDNL